MAFLIKTGSIGRLFRMSDWILAVIFFVGGLGIAAGITWLLVQRGKRGFGLDHPNEQRKQHTTATPRTGGLGLMIVLLVGGITVWVSPMNVPQLPALLLCSLLIFTLGFCDDLKPLNSNLKLFGQIGIASLAWFMGLRIELLANPLGGELELAGLVSFSATLLWLVAVPNIVNLIDGMDGLAAGLGLFLCGTLAVVGLLSEFQQDMGILCFAFVGALSAFLIFNFPPARIFLGDGGAYLIGFFVASSSLGSSQKSYIAASLCVTVIALGLPILDTAFAIMRRWFRGMPVMRGDAEHFHHQLLGLGYTSNRALFLIYGVCIVFALAGLSVYLSKGATLPISIGLILFVGVIGARYMGYVRSWRKLNQSFRRVRRTRREVRYANLQANLLLLESERCDSAEEFWAKFQEALEKSKLFIQPPTDSSIEPTPVVVRLPTPGVESWTLYHLNENDRYDWPSLAHCYVWPFEVGAKAWKPPMNWDLTLNQTSDGDKPDSAAADLERGVAHARPSETN